jgi:hypothetical protein
MRIHGEDGLTATAHLRLINRAIREDWPVSAEQRAKSVEFLGVVIENADGEHRVKDVIHAVRLMVEMSNRNLRNAVAIHQQELNCEKFQALERFEGCLNECLADGKLG